MLNSKYFYNARNFVEELHSALTNEEKKILIDHINNKKLPSISAFIDENKHDIFKFLSKTPAERAKIKKYNNENNCYKHYLILFAFVYGVLGCINMKIISNIFEDGSYRGLFSDYSELVFPTFNQDIVKMYFRDFYEVEQYINDF